MAVSPNVNQNIGWIDPSDIPAAIRNLESALINYESANFRNLLDGGDFTTNPFQRNIPGISTSNFLTTAITAANTPTYFADRWFGNLSAAGSMNMGAVANTTVAGFNTALRVQRTAGNSAGSVISLGQVLETADSIRAQGQPVVLSFWAASDANYSGGNLAVQVISGTGTNQSASSMVQATWTGQANVVNASQAITSTMTRYEFSGVVPVGCTQLGVEISWTPSGTAGTTDAVDFMGLQLEIGSYAGPFEHRDIQVELEIAQRYAWVTAEPAAGVIVGAGTTTTANSQTFYMATPVSMRAAPAVSRVTGNFSVAAGAAAAVAAITAGTTHTANAISITSAVTAAAGVGALLEGGGGAGYILASADF